MKFFLDTADIREIKTALSWGMLDGVTTNPTLIAKEKKPFRQVVEEICRTVPGPVSLETVATTAEEMVAEGKKLHAISENVVVKLPVCLEGLEATRILGENRIPVNMTLCFSPLQAIMAAKSGAAYVSPFVGRLDDAAHTGMDLIRQIVQIYDNYEYATEVLVASVRHPLHVVEAAMMGADVATVPFGVMERFVKHPLTDAGIQKFLEDQRKIPAS